MNYIEKIINAVNLDMLHSLPEQYHELAITKMVCKEVSKYYYRDERFFLFKEDLNIREEIYKKEINNNELNVTCNSLCKLIKKILKEKYNIDSELITIYTDKYAHIDLLIKCKNNKKYIINPLMDLINFKVGKKNIYFATKESYDMYKEKINELLYLSDSEIQMIDNSIKYPQNGVYFEDVNKSDILNDETIIKTINYILTNRNFINGIVDLKIFANSQFKSLCGDKIHVDDFYFYKNNFSDEIGDLEFSCNGKTRGLLIKYNKQCYILPTNKNNYIKVPEEKWDKLLSENNIKVNEFIAIDNLNKLKKKSIDRNILHNKEFLKIFKYYEDKAKKEQEDIMEYIDYSINSIRIKYQCDLLFYIKENHLVMVDKLKNEQTVITFLDECENKNKIIKLKARDKGNRMDEYLDKTDILGIFEITPNNSKILPYLTKIGNNYLSRNYREYYNFESQRDLLFRREKLINIIIKEKNNLTNDEKYVIFENILNISARIYYLDCLNNILSNKQSGNMYSIFVTDVINYNNFILGIDKEIKFHESKQIQLVFDEKKVLSEKKQIELDNKIHIHNYVKNINYTLCKLGIEKYTIITPGFGSIYIGPFIKAMYDNESTILLYSQYKKTNIEQIDNCTSIRDLVVQEKKIKKQNIILLDDNVGTGTTLSKIATMLKNEGYNIVLSGAYQYTFDRLQEFSIKNRNQEVFEPSQIDLLTPVNYPRHQIIETASKKLEISGEEYINYIKKFGYHNEKISDYDRMILDGLYFFHRYSGESMEKDDKIKNSSKILIKKMLPQRLQEIRKEYL